MQRSFVAVLTLVLALLAAPAMAQTTCPDPNPQPTPDASLQAALTEINRLRAQAGAPALAFDSRLNTAAQLHSEDQARMGRLSHYGSDGSNPGTRITRAGYRWSSYGENVAAGYPDWAAAIRGWMNSSGHRANMLRASHKHIGLGVQNRYYTAVFASPR